MCELKYVSPQALLFTILSLEHFILSCDHMIILSFGQMIIFSLLIRLSIELIINLTDYQFN